MPNFVTFTAYIAEVAHEEKLHTHSPISPILFDALGTEALSLQNKPENNTLRTFTVRKFGIK